MPKMPSTRNQSMSYWRFYSVNEGRSFQSLAMVFQIIRRYSRPKCNPKKTRSCLLFFTQNFISDKIGKYLKQFIG